MIAGLLQQAQLVGQTKLTNLLQTLLTVQLFASFFHSFKAGIANTASSLK